MARVNNDKGVALGEHFTRTALRSGGVGGAQCPRHQFVVDHIARAQHSTVFSPPGYISSPGGRRPRTALRDAHR